MVQWDGAVVHRSATTARHPQDFVRAKNDRQLADLVRPKTPDVFSGPLTTTLAANAGPGSFSLVLTSTVGMQLYDRISIILDSGDRFIAIITDILDLQNITILMPLPRGGLQGAIVVNMGTAVSNDPYVDGNYWDFGYNL